MPVTKVEKEWEDEAFGPTGNATAAKMKVPGPQGHSAG